MSRKVEEKNILAFLTVTSFSGITYDESFVFSILLVRRQLFSLKTLKTFRYVGLVAGTVVFLRRTGFPHSKVNCCLRMSTLYFESCVIYGTLYICSIILSVLLSLKTTYVVM